jgi:WD40 repeat protein
MWGVATEKLRDGTPVIAYGDDSGAVSLWELDTGKAVGEPFAAHPDTIFALAMGKRNDGTPVLVTGGRDRTVRIWSLGP